MKIEFISSGDTSDQLTNINVAKALIEHETSFHNRILNREETTETFDVDDLDEIANYLLVYCKFRREEVLIPYGADE